MGEPPVPSQGIGPMTPALKAQDARRKQAVGKLPDPWYQGPKRRVAMMIRPNVYGYQFSGLRKYAALFMSVNPDEGQNGCRRLG